MTSRKAVAPKENSFEWFRQVQMECRASMCELAKLYPKCFTKDGKPIMATLTFPKLNDSK